MTRSLLALAALSVTAWSTVARAMPAARCRARFFAAQRDGRLNAHTGTAFARARGVPRRARRVHPSAAPPTWAPDPRPMM
ncbi:hypothetical protein [Methylobacterium sp. CM6257]